MSLPRISAVSSIVPGPPISSPQPFPVVVLQLSTGSFLGVDWCYENGPLGRDPLSINPQALPVITPELTSELLYCLSALPDPWPMAKITIDSEKPGRSRN